MLSGSKKSHMIDAANALAGRDQRPFSIPAIHTVFGTPLEGGAPDGHETAIFGMGCFWGAERKFWQVPNVFSTAVGYAGGFTPHPTYQEVCSGRTGHNEVVLVTFDPTRVAFETLLKTFWESHDPTQGMRQGNDLGTQYRSGIYCTTDDQLARANESKLVFAKQLNAAGMGEITSEIVPAPTFYFAEDYHQQYLDKNPGGYCGLGGTGVGCPIGLEVEH